MAEKDGARPASGRELPSESWPLRHSLLVVVGGALTAAIAFGVVFRLVGGAEFDPRFRAGLRAATAVAAATAGLLTWARLDLSRREHHLAVRVEDSRLDQSTADSPATGISTLSSASPARSCTWEATVPPAVQRDGSSILTTRNDVRPLVAARTPTGATVSVAVSASQRASRWATVGKSTPTTVAEPVAGADVR